MYREEDRGQAAQMVTDGPDARQNRKAEQRKASVERLMAIARQHVIFKGYLSTSVEEIAAGAGLSKGAVYFYFKSKANLLLALIDEAERVIVDPAVAAVAEKQGSARDQLVAFLHAQSKAGQQHAEWMMLIILMSVELHGKGGAAEERLAAINDRIKATISGIVEAGMREGTIASDISVRELVTVIFAVNQGCFLEWYRYGADLDGEALVRALRTTVLRGVLA